MGFFDSLKRQAESALKREVSQGINKAVNNAVGAAGAVMEGRRSKRLGFIEHFHFLAPPRSFYKWRIFPTEE